MSYKQMTVNSSVRQTHSFLAQNIARFVRRQFARRHCRKLQEICKCARIYGVRTHLLMFAFLPPVAVIDKNKLFIFVVGCDSRGVV